MKDVTKKLRGALPWAHEHGVRAAAGAATALVVLAWFGVFIDYLATRNSMRTVSTNVNITGIEGLPMYGLNDESGVDRLNQFHKYVYWFPGVSFALAWGLKTVAVCPHQKTLKIVTMTANVLEGLASFVFGGIALIAISLTYLDNAKERLLPIEWATLGGLFLAGNLAAGLKLRSGHRSPVGITIQNMQLGFVALLFYTMSEATPGAALAHKTIALFFVAGNAQPDCGDAGVHARSTRYLNFFTAAIFLCVIGGTKLSSDPIVLAEWSESWTEPNDSYWPVLVLFWASSIVTALWAVSGWVHKACEHWKKGKGKEAEAPSSKLHQLEEKIELKASAIASALVGLAWLGILITFLATISQMSGVVDIQVRGLRAPATLFSHFLSHRF